MWETVKLPDGKILAPGAVSHSDAADRAPGPGLRPPAAVRRHRRARRTSSPRTDCGLGLRCHPQIAWAKLKALSEGAALASRALWAGCSPDQLAAWFHAGRRI